MSEKKTGFAIRAWLAGGACASIAIVVAIWAAAHRNAPLANGGARVGAGVASAPGSIGQAVAFARFFPAGVEQTYELRQSTSLTTAAGQPITRLQLQGPIKLGGIDESDRRIRVRGEFTGSLETGVSADAAATPEATFAGAAQRPFVLEFTADGRFAGASGEPGLPPFVGRLWTSLGEYLQWVRVAASDRWESRERDATGEYVAAYEFRGATRIAKRKLRYTSLAVNMLRGYDVRRSDEWFQVDEHSTLESFEVEEATHAEVGGGPVPGFDGATTLSLRRTGATVQLARVAGWLEEAGRAVPLRESSHGDDELARDRARTQGLTLAEALDRVKMLGAADAGADARDRAARAFVALAALLRQNPDGLAEVRKLLAARGPLTTTLLAALRDASTPEAQKLLAEMTSKTSPLDAEGRMEAARSLSLVATPTSDSVQALEKLRDDPELSAQGTYGLGSALHRLQEQDPALAADVRNTLTQQLSAAGTEGDRAGVLTAFGNAGDPTTLDLIRPFVHDQSPKVRAAAAQALRRIAGSDADSLLAALCADPVASVRDSAVDAISERPASDVLVSALTTIALGDPVFRPRARAVNVLVQWLHDRAAIADTLEIVAEKDQSADIRNVARHALDNRG